jgi:hypothetical protein
VFGTVTAVRDAARCAHCDERKIRPRRRSGLFLREHHARSYVQRLLEPSLTPRGATCAQFVENLSEIAVSETEANIRNMLAGGKFTAIFLIQCLSAIGCHTLRLESD